MVKLYNLVLCGIVSALLGLPAGTQGVLVGNDSEVLREHLKDEKEVDARRLGYYAPARYSQDRYYPSRSRYPERLGRYSSPDYYPREYGYPWVAPAYSQQRQQQSQYGSGGGGSQSQSQSQMSSGGYSSQSQSQAQGTGSRYPRYLQANEDIELPNVGETFMPYDAACVWSIQGTCTSGEPRSLRVLQDFGFEDFGGGGPEWYGYEDDSRVVTPLGNRGMGPSHPHIVERPRDLPGPGPVYRDAFLEPRPRPLRYSTPPMERYEAERDPRYYVQVPRQQQMQAQQSAGQGYNNQMQAQASKGKYDNSQQMQAQQSAGQGYNNKMQAQASKGKYDNSQQMQAQEARAAPLGRYASGTDTISAQAQMQKTEGSNGGATAQMQMQKDEASGSDQLQMQRNAALLSSGDDHDHRYEAGNQAQAQMQREGGANVRSKNREFRGVKLEEEPKRIRSEEQLQLQMSELTRNLKEKEEARKRTKRGQK